MNNSKSLRVSMHACNLCKTNRHERVLADRIIRSLPENERFGGSLKIVECGACGLRYLNPMPHPDDISLIYDFDVYNDSTNNNEILQQEFHGLLRKYKPEVETVLEVGCGTGEFLAHLEKEGLEVAGVEFSVSPEAVKFMGKLYSGKIEDVGLPEGSFDAVFLLNVMEHLANPQEVLKKVNIAMKKNGVLILRHPNSDLFFNAGYRKFVEMPKYLIHMAMKIIRRKTRFTILGFQNQHLFYYNFRTMRNLLAKCGFDTEYFSTLDPYNYERMKKTFHSKKYLEAAVAFIRHLLGKDGLGPECIWVARKTV